MSSYMPHRAGDSAAKSLTSYSTTPTNAPSLQNGNGQFGHDSDISISHPIHNGTPQSKCWFTNIHFKFNSNAKNKPAPLLSSVTLNS
ncbi:unnamed protein product [Ceratitis capitata]|uniref:(Mediterranean fruit fly) hypothetical protein n=1 Tax=Ceratitis capitata TaxID=7213 RepID=A0A811U9I3_CERCA|nr:unnamed protein product [Ceratitis capitata]